VSDLAPLAGMPLKALTVSGTRIRDLSPLEGQAKLTNFHCRGTEVSDLSPHKGAPLKVLFCDNTKVSDLSALKGMPLTELYLWGREVDLAPLEGMPLKSLYCPFKPDRDAPVLRSLKSLERLNGQPVELAFPGLHARRPSGGRK
jgi:hypothetical protein